jgi:hypothetical protein
VTLHRADYSDHDPTDRHRYAAAPVHLRQEQSQEEPDYDYGH